MDTNRCNITLYESSCSISGRCKISSRIDYRDIHMSVNGCIITVVCPKTGGNLCTRTIRCGKSNQVDVHDPRIEHKLTFQ